MRSRVMRLVVSVCVRTYNIITYNIKTYSNNISIITYNIIRNRPLTQVFTQMEQMKHCSYDQRVRDIEHGTMTP